MIKRKSDFEYIKQIRKGWGINPVTKVHESDLANKKKRRQKEKKIIKDDFDNEY